MDFHLKVTLWLFSIILSFYISIFIFLDVGRYCRLRNNKSSIQNHIKNFEKLSPLNNVVVSIALNENENLDDVKPMISSILDQTVKTHIIINYVNKPVNKIPDDYSMFATLKPKENNSFGKFFNLLPILLSKDTEDDSKILVINNNNVIFGKDFINTAVKKSKENPNKIILSNSNDICSSDAYVVEPNFFKSFKDFKDDCAWIYSVIKPEISYLQFQYKENYNY